MLTFVNSEIILMTDYFQAQNISCNRGEKCVFKGLSFSLQNGGALILRGPNGSGKSSLLRMMAGLSTPAEGELLWNKENIAQDPFYHRDRIHYLGHFNAVKPALTVKENLAVWQKLRGTSSSVRQEEKKALERALIAFDMLHLADLPARLLSSGESRRLALARLLANNASLWLLDEPANGLDDSSRRALEEIVSEHQVAGGMVVISVHGPSNLTNTHTLNLSSNAYLK